MSPHAAAGQSLFTRVQPLRVQNYLDAVIQTCARNGTPVVSLILFGSAAKGGFSSVSDVDLIIVLADGTTRDDRRRLREQVTSLETDHGFRPAAAQAPGALQARIERAVGHLFSCCICTRGDLLSGDVARVLDLRRWEAPFVDRITFAGIIASAATIVGEDLVPQVRVPRVRRLDVFKALFVFTCQLVLAIATFPVLPDATKYAMAALKHSLHSCYFWYHARTAALDDEVAFFNRRFGASRTLVELLALRRRYRPSFAFVIRCVATVASLHARTARDAPFASTTPPAPFTAAGV
jgi:predicted nucleotidyltransferase